MSCATWAPVAAGDFQIALMVDGVRGSNVVAFTIDPRYNPMGEPVLRVGMIEAPPGEKLGSLAWWAVGPTPEDPRLTDMTVAGPAIWADGRLVHPEGVGSWAGPVAPIPSGNCQMGTCSAQWLPGIDPNQAHDFYVAVHESKWASDSRHALAAPFRNYGSQTVRLNLADTPLAHAWDAATLSRRTDRRAQSFVSSERQRYQLATLR